MKKIVKKVPAHTVVSYQCEVCKTKHRTKRKAEECEARTLEKQKFALRQEVRSVELRFCGGGRTYRAQGKVVRVFSELPDTEYEAKWLGGTRERLGSHVRRYEVEFVCPYCENTQNALYYAPELEAIK